MKNTFGFTLPLFHAYIISNFLMQFYAKLFLFNKYLKSCKDGINYLLNDAAINFISEYFDADIIENGAVGAIGDGVEHLDDVFALFEARDETKGRLTARTVHFGRFDQNGIVVVDDDGRHDVMEHSR